MASPSPAPPGRSAPPMEPFEHQWPILNRNPRTGVVYPKNHPIRRRPDVHVHMTALAGEPARIVNENPDQTVDPFRVGPDHCPFSRRGLESEQDMLGDRNGLKPLDRRHGNGRNFGQAIIDHAAHEVRESTIGVRHMA